MLPKKPALESSPPQAGSAEQPIPPASPDGQGVQPPSMGQTELPEEYAEYVKSLVHTEVDRAFQTQKDRRIPKLEQKQADLDTRLAAYERYRSQGLEPAQAARELKLDEFIASQEQVEVPEVGGVRQERAGTPQMSEASKVVLGVLQQAGIPANDPGVAAVLRSGSLEQMTKASAQLIIERATTPAPTPGARAAPSGGETPKTETSVDDLQKQYEARKAELRPGDVDGLVGLKSEFKKKGLKNLY
jgi:hypothetical protein